MSTQIKKYWPHLSKQEKFFQLGELIFDTDIVGQNPYYCFRRLMRDYKVNPKHGICICAAWMSQLNNFIPFMQNNALDKKGVEKALFTKIDIWEILDSALPKTY